MAEEDFNIYKPDFGGFDYPDKYDSFVVKMEEYAGEIEEAREGNPTLKDNLQNYARYELVSNIDGSVVSGQETTSGYKFTNMQDGRGGSNDYATMSQVEALSDSTLVSVLSLEGGPGLNANDAIVIDNTGLLIVGRPSAMGTVKTIANHNDTLVNNNNIAFDLTSGNFTLNLPAPVADGDQIKFNDINGTVNGTTTYLTISPNGTDKIMGNQDDLLVQDYPYVSFTLVWVAAATSWYITDLQR